MASVINGTNIILYRYNPDTGLSTPFGSATSCSFDATTDQVEVTSQSSAWYREFKNDIMSWTVSCDGFMRLDTDYSYLSLIGMQQDQINGETMTIKFSIDNDNGGTALLGHSVFTGTANITSMSLSGSVEGASTYSVSLQGTGPYVISGTVPTPGGTIITAGGAVYMKQYTAAGGENSITWTDMIGKLCLGFTRGGVEVREIYSSGTPTGDQIVFLSATGEVKFGRTLESDEFIRGIFQ
jgi:predicted secreted protein